MADEVRPYKPASPAAMSRAMIRLAGASFRQSGRDKALFDALAPVSRPIAKPFETLQIALR